MSVGLTHPAELDTFHRQPGLVATAMAMRPPAWPIGADGPLTSKRQGASRCVSVATKSFTRSVADRLRGAVFSFTVSITVPSPCPAAGSTATHGASLVTVHPHSREAETVRVERRPELDTSEGTPDTTG